MISDITQQFELLVDSIKNLLNQRKKTFVHDEENRLIEIEKYGTEKWNSRLIGKFCLEILHSIVLVLNGFMSTFLVCKLRKLSLKLVKFDVILWS